MAEYLAPEKKQELFEKYGKSNTDTGSPESQVALFPTVSLTLPSTSRATSTTILLVVHS